MQIEVLRRSGKSIRGVAKVLGRSPNTISRELKEKTVKEIYDPKKAQQKTYVRRQKSKRECMKVAKDRYLSWFVDTHVRQRWSPERMSGYLRLMGYEVSTKAIYTFIRSRSLDGYLLYTKRKRKQKKHTPQWADGRKYIDTRPDSEDYGHFEADFIVSAKNSASLLVVVEKYTRHTWIEWLPNRKHATVTRAFQRICSDINAKTLTLDNDISFSHWRKLEEVLGTEIYFTHPYSSWEKGLVENTNRWIRLFVPKSSDIALVSHPTIQDALRWLNDLPRQCINFQSSKNLLLECNEGVS